MAGIVVLLSWTDRTIDAAVRLERFFIVYAFPILIEWKHRIEKCFSYLTDPAVNVSLYEFVVFPLQFFLLLVELGILFHEATRHVCPDDRNLVQLFKNVDWSSKFVVWILFTFLEPCYDLTYLIRLFLQSLG